MAENLKARKLVYLHNQNRRMIYLKPLTTLFSVFICFFAISQPNLLPHIGTETNPEPSEPICDIPIYLGGMHESGYSVGDTVNDFTLFTPEGVRFNLADKLADGRPVLLLSITYTCWRWRHQVDVLNQVVYHYGDQVDVYLINTVEAHPHITPSPYSGELWTGNPNFEDDVLYEQPVTYGERLSVIADMQADLSFNAPVLVDDPCNQWWLNYGPAPNNAYLIDPNGIVQVKHPWFNSYPSNIQCDMATYLGEDVGDDCDELGNEGSFMVELASDEIVQGFPGEVITVPATIVNFSSTDNAVVRIVRQDVFAPDSWQTALCVDVCLNYTVDETMVTIPPASEQSFLFYFFTTQEVGVGSANVLFRNLAMPDNDVTLTFRAMTDFATSSEELEDQPVFQVFPNPATDNVFVESSSGQDGVVARMFNITGAEVWNRRISSGRTAIDVSGYSSGLYFLRAGSETHRVFVK